MTLKYQISNISPRFGEAGKCQKGQIVLMLVLITIVGLTIGLSLISRTVTDIRISSQIEQSGRAFSAAEAGIENALKSQVVGGPTGTVNLPGASGSYSVSQIGGSAAALTFPVTSPDTSQTVWLAGHNTDGTLNETLNSTYDTNFAFDVCWGADPNVTPAMTVSLFYRTGTVSPYTYKVARASYDTLAADRGNGFSTVVESGGANYCNGNYRFRKTVTPKTDLGVDPGVAGVQFLFLRIRPVYANSLFAVAPKAPAILPVQSKVINSVGQTTSGVVRKIQVVSGNNELPAIFDFALFVEN